jgi:hypothetical protein
MILFKAQHVEPILAGRKTQTRRRGKLRWRVGSVQQCRRGFHAEPFAHVRIVRRWQERLGDISEADARAEGYWDSEDYLAAFRAIHNGHADLDEVVACYEFEVVQA